MNPNTKSNTKPKKIKFWLLILTGLFSVFLGLVIILLSTLRLPDFKSFTERKVANSTKIYDRTGEILLYDVHKDMRRTVIPFEDMGTNIKNATIAIEDSEFYNHKGIRITSIIRALWQRFLGNQKAGGGSTITQQLIKNTLLTQEKTLTRKIKEWILAIKLERIISKDEILGLYLNEAPYGGTVYGIKEGARMFFGKEPRDITIAESAYLAAIPNSPTYYSPYKKHKAQLDERKNLVLKRMFDLGYITNDEYQKSVNEVVVFLPEQPTNIKAPHFVFFIKDYLENKYGAEALDVGGLKVITTLDASLQEKAEAIVAKQAEENAKNANGKNAAAVVIETKTGQILSMVGSRNYFDKEIEGNFNVVTAQRQPGSAFKPFVYALAFKNGYTDKTTLFDVKTQFSDSCDAVGNPIGGASKDNCYMPNNYDNAFRGPMTLRDALAQSINVIAVKLLYLVGVTDSIKLAHDMGVTSLNDPSRYGLSLVIGGGEVSLLDMTSAYGVFATEGIRQPYTGILSVEDKDGVKTEEYKENPTIVLDPNTTRIISDILSDEQARVPTFGSHSSLYTGDINSAAKTGTTNSNKDAWTIGYTTSITVGAWVGNNDNTPMKKGGAALAGPIWNQIIKEASVTYPAGNFNKPEYIDRNLPPILRGFWQGGETFTIDSMSGKLATENTPDATKVETSITNVHTILYWLDKNNPTGGKTNNPESDPQYKRWEYGVQKWWENNKHKYKTITEGNKPTSYDSIHTENNKPLVYLSGIDESVVYDGNQEQIITITTNSSSPIQKIDIFINNLYITSLKSSSGKFSITPNEVQGVSSVNKIRALAYDIYGSSSQTEITLQIK